MKFRGNKVNHFYKVTPLNNDRVIPIPLTPHSALTTPVLSINAKRKVQYTGTYRIIERKVIPFAQVAMNCIGNQDYRHSSDITNIS